MPPRKLALALLMLGSASVQAQYGMMQPAFNPLALLAPLAQAAAPVLAPYGISNPMGMTGFGSPGLPLTYYNPQALTNPYLNPMAANNPYLNPRAGMGNPFLAPPAPIRGMGGYYPMSAQPPYYGGYGVQQPAPTPSFFPMMLAAPATAAPPPSGWGYYGQPALSQSTPAKAPATSFWGGYGQPPTRAQKAPVAAVQPPAPVWGGYGEPAVSPGIPATATSLWGGYSQPAAAVQRLPAGAVQPSPPPAPVWGGYGQPAPATSTAATAPAASPQAATAATPAAPPPFDPAQWIKLLGGAPAGSPAPAR